MLLRNKKKNDVNHGKYIGFGGKKENGETMAECAAREVREETGFTLINLKYHGTVYFNYPDAEEHIKIYTSDAWYGEPIECTEGTPVWVDEDQILSLNLWEGDRLFLQKILSGSNEEFVMHLIYDKSGRLMESYESEVNQ